MPDPLEPLKYAPLCAGDIKEKVRLSGGQLVLQLKRDAKLVQINDKEKRALFANGVVGSLMVNPITITSSIHPEGITSKLQWLNAKGGVEYPDLEDKLRWLRAHLSLAAHSGMVLQLFQILDDRHQKLQKDGKGCLVSIAHHGHHYGEFHCKRRILGQELYNTQVADTLKHGDHEKANRPFFSLGSKAKAARVRRWAGFWVCFFWRTPVHRGLEAGKKTTPERPTHA